MSPENARIFLLEDDEIGRETTKEILHRSGHTVVLEAANKKEAIQALPKFKKKKVNVAVLDNNLDPEDDHNRDGNQVGHMIRKRHPGVIIVGNSSYPLESAHKQNTSKSGFGLAEVVTKA